MDEEEQYKKEQYKKYWDSLIERDRKYDQINAELRDKGQRSIDKVIKELEGIFGNMREDQKKEVGGIVVGLAMDAMHDTRVQSELFDYVGNEMDDPDEEDIE